MIVFSSLASAFTAVFLGIFVYLKNPKSQKNISLSLFAVSVFWWLLCYSIAYSVASAQAAKLFFTIGYLGVIFIVITAHHFVASAIEKNSEKKYVILSYALGVIFSGFLLYSPLFIKGIAQFPWGFYPLAGPIHLIYMIFLVSMVFRFMWLLFLNYRNKPIGLERERAKYIFLAIFIFSFAALDFLPNYKIVIYPVGYLFVLLYTFIIAYAIVRHRLLDIEVIIKKTIVFASLFAVVLGVFVGVTMLMQELVAGGRILGLAISSVIIILFVRPLEDFLIKITDKFLFQKKYDYLDLLSAFTTEVLSVMNIEKLTSMTVNKLSSIIQLKSCAVLLYDKEKAVMTVAASAGVDSDGIIFDKGDKFLTVLRESDTLIKKNIEDRTTIALNGIFHKLNAEIVFPLIIMDKLVGALSLGKKKSDADFTEEDIEVLCSLAKTEAIAIANAQLFDELGKTQAEAAQKEKMAAIGTLSAGINHEICNPLGIIVAQNEAMILNYKKGRYKDISYEELFKRSLEIMGKTIELSHRATGITSRLTNFAKPAKETVFDKVNVESKIDDALTLLSHDIKLNNIEVVKIIPKGLSDIRVDAKQIGEILFNLIRNSVQAMDKHDGKITIAAAETDGTVIIKISDNGCGISDEGMSKLFNPFYTTKGPDKGTGLGLYIVRQVIERNNGRISVSSKVGEGTTFTVEFEKANPAV